MYLIISTLPHFLSIIPIIKYYKSSAFLYINIIVLSSTFSILYHYYEQSNTIINVFDYFFAVLWVLYDIKLTYKTPAIYKILFGNCSMCLINIVIDYSNNYIIAHSLWHLLNASKCIYVSTLLNEQFKETLR
jgi:hypothetical protein